jgi:hypothetical protein
VYSCSVQQAPSPGIIPRRSVTEWARHRPAGSRVSPWGTCHRETGPRDMQGAPLLSGRDPPLQNAGIMRPRRQSCTLVRSMGYCASGACGLAAAAASRMNSVPFRFNHLAKALILEEDATLLSGETHVWRIEGDSMPVLLSLSPGNPSCAPGAPTGSALPAGTPPSPS